MVKAYRGATKARLWSVDAFSSAFTGGVSVAAVSLDGTTGADVVAGAGAGGGSRIKVIDGRSAALVSSFLGATGSNAIGVAAG